MRKMKFLSCTKNFSENRKLSFLLNQRKSQNPFEEKKDLLLSHNDSMKEGKWKEQLDALMNAKQKALDSYAIVWANLLTKNPSQL